MTIKDINKLFTDKMMEYINDGYIVNTNTMGGTQGEQAMVDLTNGEYIIRLYIDIKSESLINHLHIIAERVKMRKKFKCGWDNTIWNGHNEVIFDKSFIEIDYGRYYVDEESDEYKEIKTKRKQRYESDFRNTRNIVYFENPKAKEIALKLIKKNPRTKTTKVKDISFVGKHLWRNERPYYIQYAKAKIIHLR